MCVLQETWNNLSGFPYNLFIHAVRQTSIYKTKYIVIYFLFYIKYNAMNCVRAHSQITLFCTLFQRKLFIYSGEKGLWKMFHTCEMQIIIIIIEIIGCVLYYIAYICINACATHMRGWQRSNVLTYLLHKL